MLHISKLKSHPRDRVDNIEDRLQVGQQIRVKVREIKEDGKVDLEIYVEESLRAARTPEQGSVHCATVRRLKPFGAFCDLGGEYGEGLLHASKLKSHYRDYVTSIVEDRLQVGQQIWVKVINVMEDGKVDLEIYVEESLRAAGTPEQGSVHLATVRRLERYGAFCELGGEYKDYCSLGHTKGRILRPVHRVQG